MTPLSFHCFSAPVDLPPAEKAVLSVLSAVTGFHKTRGISVSDLRHRVAMAFGISVPMARLRRALDRLEMEGQIDVKATGLRKVAR
jgi:hypothetical protein